MGLAGTVPSSSAAAFARWHRWDRGFFLACAIAIWLPFVLGFVPEVINHIRTHQPEYPLIVHLHAAAFIGWLVLLTAQIVLVRIRRTDIHRRVGVAGGVLAAAMVVLGPAAALYTQREYFGTPKGDAPFLIVQLTDIVAFAGFVAAALVLRGNSPAHKRLMVLATFYISDAGLARAFGDTFHSMLGDGFWPFLVEAYLLSNLLVVGMGIYDRVTRGRLHPAYVAGVAWTLAMQVTSSFLYQAEFWKPISLRLIGH